MTNSGRLIQIAANLLRPKMGSYGRKLVTG